MGEVKPLGMKGITREWITVSEAARVIGCCTTTVLRLVAGGVIRGQLVHPRMYLVNIKDVNKEAKESKGLSPIGRPRGS